MEQKIKKTENLPGVRLDEELLKRILDNISDLMPGCIIELSARHDDLKLTFDSYEDLISHDSAFTHPLDTLIVQAKNNKDSWNVTESILITFSDSMELFHGGVELFMEYDDYDKYEVAHQKLTSLLKEYKLKFSWVRTNPLLWFVSGTAAVLYFTFNSKYWHFELISNVVMALLFFNIATLETNKWFIRLKHKFFPQCEIYFGVNKKRIDDNNHLREVIFISVILAIVVGLVVNFISKGWK